MKAFTAETVDPPLLLVLYRRYKVLLFLLWKSETSNIENERKGSITCALSKFAIKDQWLFNYYRASSIDLNPRLPCTRLLPENSASVVILNIYYSHLYKWDAKFSAV